MKKCTMAYGCGTWNQLVLNGNFASIGGWTPTYGTISANDGGVLYKVTTVGNYSQNRITRASSISLTQGNKYLVVIDAKPLTKNYEIWFISYNSEIQVSTLYGIVGNYTLNKRETKGAIMSASYNGNVDIRITFGSNSKALNDQIQVYSVQLFNLTDIFGSGNEPTTYSAARTLILQRTGKDVEQFQPYDTGTTYVAKARLAYEKGISIRNGKMVLPRLPRTYQEVEYIQSNGSQKIKLNITPKSTYKIEEKFAVTDNTVNSTIWCSRGATTRSNTLTTFVIRSTHETPGLRGDYYDDTTQWLLTGAVPINVPYIITMDSNVYYLNGEQKIVHPARNFTGGGPLSLFVSYFDGINNNLDNYSKMKLYYFRVWDENRNVVGNFIPCYRKSDSVIGMYDLVSNTFFTNSGSGTFTKGPDVFN